MPGNKLHFRKKDRPPSLSNMLFGIKNHSDIGFIRHLLNQFTLKVFTVSAKSKKSRPPSLLELASTSLFNL